MADDSDGNRADEAPSAEQQLSYKFQRLRERIRKAIQSGELAGKLPGERELAKRFKVNTKTLSKALTELAADGLVERSIGLGTFVRGDAPREAARALLIFDHERAEGLLKYLDPAAIELTVLPESTDLPPSLLNRFDTVVIASDRPSDETIRDLVVRGKRVITIGTRQASFSTRAILIDQAAAAAVLAQRLVHRGHANLMLVGYDADGEIAAAVHQAVGKDKIRLATGQLPDMCDAITNGTTGLIVTPAIDPRQAIEHCRRNGHIIPANVSVLAIGWADGQPSYSGVFVQASQTAAALTQLLDQPVTTRPVTVWLTGVFSDGGTLDSVAAQSPPPLS